MEEIGDGGGEGGVGEVEDVVGETEAGSHDDGFRPHSEDTAEDHHSGDGKIHAQGVEERCEGSGGRSRVVGFQRSNLGE
eukprot:evm.model.NODE_28748_length_1039_cov_6.387873.1